MDDMCDSDSDCDEIYFHIYGGTCTDYHPQGCYCEKMLFDGDSCVPKKPNGEDCGSNHQCQSECCRGFMFWQTCESASECN